MTKPKSTTFSLIIPTLNEEKFLPLLLQDLVSQTYPHFEVIVVDGHSDDRTLAKAKKYSSQVSLTIVGSEQRNVSAQRNLGAHSAKNEWLIFMDADDRVSHYFLQGLAYQIAKHADLEVFTCWLDAKAYTRADRPMIQVANLIIELYSKIQPVALGALIGAHRKVIKDTTFNEKNAYGEDAEFVQEAVKHHHKFCVLHEPTYVTSLRRLKKTGTLKSLRLFAQMQVNRITKGKIPGFHPIYPMDGGRMYEELTEFPFSWYEHISSRFSELSQQQKQRLWDVLKKFEL